MLLCAFESFEFTAVIVDELTEVLSIFKRQIKPIDNAIDLRAPWR
ncbi:hypothetical protein AMBAS45_10140 [Alteromonas macleodii str. 'Balearic Sea AD45']|nr:hypothetical protein AMBAS45_10140 [Alteromonas macleodii str. 'Balearic Sea AD45']|tara:strand:+ start:1453 stop:1587 length:135 start_codon:yes stop_codon:yes gene_type:complete